jgi:hypothetical protein
MSWLSYGTPPVATSCTGVRSTTTPRWSAGGPPETRNQAASELRSVGRRAEAYQVKALRKPSVPAAAVNRLVREHRRQVEAFLEAAARLRDAQFAGKGDLQGQPRMSGRPSSG